MIRIVPADPEEVEGEALVRGVGEDLEGITAWSRRVGLAAGPRVAERLSATGPLPLGGAVVTPGGELSVGFLIHVVLLTREEGVSEEGVARGLRNALRQAARWEVATLVVPPLGIGPGSLDAEASARVMVRILKEHAEELPFPARVTIPVASAYEEEAFRRELAGAWPEADRASSGQEDE